MSSQTKSYQIVLETNTITESKMSADKVINAECPICMDAIEGLCNRVVTECGHAFHCACLMQNASHNGFGCPYCRTAMATEPLNEDDDDDDGWSVDETVFEENALTSFRLFHQRNTGEELEEEEEDWETDSESEAEEEEEEEEPVQAPAPVAQVPVTETPSVPDSTYTSNKLKDRGVTFEDLVKHILNTEHDQWGEHYGDYTRRSDEGYGQFKAVMSNYARSQRIQRTESVQTETTTQTPNPVLTLPEVAESKTPVTRQREVLAHV